MKKTRREAMYELTQVETGEKSVLSINQISELFKISRNTVYYWIRKGYFGSPDNVTVKKKENYHYNTTNIGGIK